MSEISSLRSESLVPTEVATSLAPAESSDMDQDDDQDRFAIEPAAGLVPVPSSAAAGNGGLGGGVSPFTPVAAQQNIYMRDERQQALH